MVLRSSTDVDGSGTNKLFSHYSNPLYSNQLYKIEEEENLFI